MTDTYKPFPWERPIGDPMHETRPVGCAPYDRQEQRVCEYLQRIAPDIGCGDDPIGFLLSLAFARQVRLEANGWRVLVFGGRDVQDYRYVEHGLNLVRERFKIGLVMHGVARGVDTLAGAWAQNQGIAVCQFPANWIKQERAAGPIRNQVMLNWGRPDLAVEFPGGDGTADMHNRVVAAGIKLIEIEAEAAKQ